MIGTGANFVVVAAGGAADRQQRPLHDGRHHPRAADTYPAVLAVDQVSRGAQWRSVPQQGPAQLWVKPLADGTLAESLFNTLDHPLDATLDFKAPGLRDVVTARDA